jgi:excisionase family DNA binding protein
MQPLAVDVREAARLTSLSTFTIRRYIRRGHIRAIRLGRRVVVPLESLEKLVRDGPCALQPVNSQSANAVSSRRKDGSTHGSSSASDAGSPRFEKVRRDELNDGR